MTVVTSRANFEKLIDLRMKEARLLLDHKNWDGAYYLVGYTVEFALKAWFKSGRSRVTVRTVHVPRCARLLRSAPGPAISGALEPVKTQ